MFYKLDSAAVYGIEARTIVVEADVSDGLPMFNMVGFLSSEVKEARDRVKTALKNSNFPLKPKRITINLSPADLRKSGTGFDLPVAIAVLIAFELLPANALDNTIVVGELSLDGTVKRINGILPIAVMAQKKGYKRIILPKDNAKEAAVVKGVEILGVTNIRQLVDYIYGEEIIEPETVDTDKLFSEAEAVFFEDFKDISGQKMCRRAVEIAVAGLHNILISGPPGAGKTMIAKRVPGIMPGLSFEESLEISRVYSTAGKLDSKRCLITKRPFCSPHHTATVASIIGGGYNAAPGAVSLASGGVLFLDELPEFNREVIESLRQPLEDKRVTVSRLNATYNYPAGFMLVASMNPCPCGNFPNRDKCTCTPAMINKYRNRISSPILDRIDICINVDRVGYESIGANEINESTAQIRKRVEEVRKIQNERYKNLKVRFNSELGVSEIKKYCILGTKEKRLMENAFNKLGLSARGYHRVLKIARTIADMEKAENIKEDHLIEALGYRNDISRSYV